MSHKIDLVELEKRLHRALEREGKASFRKWIKKQQRKSNLPRFIKLLKSCNTPV